MTPALAVSRHPGCAFACALAVFAGCLAAASAPAQATAAARWAYVCPVPGSTRVSPTNGIALREGRELDAGSVARARVLVVGTASGVHTGRAALSDDRRTLLFTPDREFARSERVTVVVAPGLETRDGDALPALSFGFTTSSVDARARRPDLMASLGLPPAEHGAAAVASRPAITHEATAAMPLDYIPVTVSNSDHPEPGVVFIAPIGGGPTSGRLEIVDNLGQPLFYRRLPGVAIDWRRLPSGRLVYHEATSNRYYALDSTYTVVDSFATVGYPTDFHDLIELPGGHVLLMAYDYEPYPMDTVVAGGSPDAIVAGCVLQELDHDHNVVWQWRSWDHFLVTDADTCMVNLRDSPIDWVHVNAMEVDTDGNLLMSSRHLSEITKLDRNTGDVIWRMGAHARRNQFTFVGDTRPVTGQHDIRRLPNGHITLFDNGNCTGPSYASRGAEYELDEVNHVATLRWQYHGTPEIYGAFMGNVQRFATGGSMIGWGGTTRNPEATELHADGTPALQLGWSQPGAWSYRAFKFPWATTRFSVAPATVDFGSVGIGQSAARPLVVHNPLATPLLITAVVTTDSAFTTDGAMPVVVPPNGDAALALRYTSRSAFDVSATMYVRSANDTELIAQPVTVVGHGLGPTLDIAGMQVTEGNSGTRVFGFQVTPTPAPIADVSVQYQTVDGSAKASELDYLATSGTLTIPAGAVSGTIPVTVLGDVRGEADETFYVQLHDPVGGVLGNAIAAGVILNDDGPLAVDGGGPPTEFALYAARPQPVRGHTSVHFDLPRAVHVRLAAYDVRGRRIETLLDADREAGRHVLPWAPRLPNGVYFLRLDAGGVRRDQRVVLLR